MKTIINDADNAPAKRENLQTGNKELRNYFENANDLIQSIGPDGSIVYANSKWLDVLGYTPQDLANFTLLILSAKTRSPIVLLPSAASKTGKLDLIELVFKTKTGREIYAGGECRGSFRERKICLHTGDLPRYL